MLDQPIETHVLGADLIEAQELANFHRISYL